MRVARLHGVGDLRVSDEPVPEVPAGHELVRVTAVGICGSDLHWFGEGGIGDARLDRPLVLGHEFAGEVDGVPVAVDPAIPCWSCALCQEGHPNLCLRIRFAGHGDTDGALREFVSWPADRLYPLPDGFSPADGAMLEPLGVAIHAADLGHLRVAMSVAVVGCGPIGLLLIQVVRAAGAGTVVAADPLPHRRDAALACGADLAVAPDADPDPYGVHVAFEVAGNDDAVGFAVRAARPGGRVVLVGIPETDRTAFPAGPARRKGLTILLSRRMKEVYPRAIGLVASGRVGVSSLVSDLYPLADAAAAFDAAAARTGLKIVVTPPPT